MDRPNCGKSDVQFYGQSESHMRAETLYRLVDRTRRRALHHPRRIRRRPDSMLTTMLYPEIVRKLVVWNIVGGVYGSFVLGGHYVTPSILAVRGLGIKGLLSVAGMARAHRAESGSTGSACSTSTPTSSSR